MKLRLSILACTFVAAAVGLALMHYSATRWTGKTLEHDRVNSGVDLVIASFHRRDTNPVVITTITSHSPQHVSIEIDFERFMPSAELNRFATDTSRQHAIAMINGGYFDATGQPVGLVIRDGAMQSALSLQPSLSGVLTIDRDGDVRLIRSDAYIEDETIKSAIQAGPFLVDPGGTQGIMSDDLKTAKRTAIGITMTGEIVFISASPCTLFELSEILSNHARRLGVDGFDRVLNLDGGPSAGLFVRGHEDQEVVPETPVPNTIVIMQRWR